MVKFNKDSIKLLAFDIDGTIFSSEGIILDTYKESIQRFVNKTGKQLTIPSKEKIMEQIGKPVKTIFINLLPELPEPERDIISNSVLEILCDKIEKGEGEIYEGVLETIQYLYSQNYILASASNGRLPYISIILKKCKIDSYFKEMVVLDYQSLKAKGDIVDFYRTKYKFNGENILMIGDRSSDRDAAIQARTPFAFCKYGHAVDGEIPDYSIQINSISELRNIL